MEKGFAGDEPAEQNLSKGEILMSKSAPDSPEAGQLLQATAEYENGGTMSKAMYAKVIDFRRNNAH